ncbi:hypothetical protein CROQUDRAFT_109010 [Cronartium quercuum f. sp. fusiforme G11]|uniref:Uncharacterized protein n=1 Tax=Cronartium quercuum f. sp. fusiforme G11 TaxID=708437 RepID=A0A9P6NGA0_9BASI|nr:hypothetical protein CROQUDRAFT_109010 [Cronartium quercuum f. sp. fusiforme G11]
MSTSLTQSNLQSQQPSQQRPTINLTQPKSQLFPLPKLTLSLTRTISNDGTTTSFPPSAPHPERDTWLGSLTSGMGLTKTRTDSFNNRPIVIADLSDRPKAGILLNRSSAPNTPQFTSTPSEQSSQPTSPAFLTEGPSVSLPLQHSASAPMPNSNSFNLPPPAMTLTQTNETIPRSLTIKFAPLPDPRSRSYSTTENHWNNLNESISFDGNSYNLNPTLDSPSSRINNEERSPSSNSEPLSNRLNTYEIERSKSPTITNKPFCRPVSPGPTVPPTQLYRTISNDSLSAVSQTSSAAAPPSQASSSTSLTQKLFSLTKPRKTSRSLNGSSSNLSTISSDYGAPLQHTRSAELSGCGWRPSTLQLRRTKSKEEERDQVRPRRRAQYPPVAQRKVHMGGSRGGAGKVSIIEEPAFVEWSSSTSANAVVESIRSRQSTTTTNSSIRSNDPIEVDDGSGMAWLKKRRREREEKAKKEANESNDKKLNGSSTLEPLTEVEEIIATTSNDSSHRKKPHHQIGSDMSSSESSTSYPTISIATSSNNTDVQDDYDENDGNYQDDEKDDEEEVRKEDEEKARVLAESPFVKGVKEVYTDREHHRVAK